MATAINTTTSPTIPTAGTDAEKARARVTMLNQMLTNSIAAGCPVDHPSLRGIIEMIAVYEDAAEEMGV